jgi:hypothetical protein
MSYWQLSNRADPIAVDIADRHYNRQKIGSPQFVPPGRCIVLLSLDNTAVWVTSWPFAEYVKHAWAGAWVNSMFRKENRQMASELIRDAIAVTRYYWEPPSLGIVTFIDKHKVKPTMRRGKETWGYSYLKAGFEEAGTTKGGLLAFLMSPDRMPEPMPPYQEQMRMPI